MEISKKPLVDILSAMLGKEIVMSGDDYVTLVGNELVDSSAVAEAVVKQETDFNRRLETTRVESINAKAAELILAKYPLYKQNNITFLLSPYTELDLEEMKIYLETVRGIAKQAKESGTPADEVDWAGL